MCADMHKHPPTTTRNESDLCFKTIFLETLNFKDQKAATLPSALDGLCTLMDACPFYKLLGRYLSLTYQAQNVEEVTLRNVQSHPKVLRGLIEM